MMDTARQKRKHRLPLSASRTRASLSIFLPFFFFFFSPFCPSSVLWQLATRLQVLLWCCLLRIRPCDLSEDGKNVYVLRYTVSSLHSVSVRAETALKHVFKSLNSTIFWEDQEDFFLSLSLKKKKYFHAEINWCWSNRLEIKYKCTVQVMKSSRSFGFAICKPVNTKQRNSKLERGIWRAKLCKRKIIKQICVSVSLQELNVKSVCRRPVIGYLWDMFLKPWRVINKTNSNRNIIGLIFQSGPASLQSAKRDIN